MNPHYFLLLFVLLSCKCMSQDNSTSDFKKLAWLQGEWNRTNVKPGRSGIEKWVLVSDSVMQGKGISLRGNDTAFVEKIQLVKRGGVIYYVADVPGNKAPVLFSITKLSNHEFVCENPEHDFPKIITYKKEGVLMKATISGNGKFIDYLFEKLETKN